MRFRPPRSSSPAAPDVESAQDQGSLTAEPDDGPAAAPPRPGRRRGLLRPLPRPRREPTDGAGDAVAEDDDEYWDDEYDDYDDYDDEESDEYDDDVEDAYDDEYDDDEYWDDEYDDDLDDAYEDEDDETGDDGEAPAAGPRGRRRLLPRRPGDGRRPRPRIVRRGRRRSGEELTPAEADTAATAGPVEPVTDRPPSERVPAPRPLPRPARPSPTGAPESVDADGKPFARPARPRRAPRLPLAAMRTRTARGWSGTRAGFHRGWSGTRSGLRRGWSATRSGSVTAWHFLRTHWDRAAYVYLAIVAGAFLVTVLLYWHSGFTYDECNYCGIPVLLTVSPWWLLLLPFGVSSWPWVVLLAVLLVFALANAEFVDRFSKRPEPEYPDWD